MTDEELHRLEIRYSDMESWDDAKQLVVECRRLRAENQRLVRLAIRSEELARWHENFELASELRAAIEGK